MKKLLFILLFAITVFHLKAQVEVKLSPVPLLFGDIALSVEGAVGESFGLDGDLWVGSGDTFDGNVAFNFSGKYYFNPEKRIDKFHVGVFLGVQNTAPGLGFLIGYKWVSSKNVVFELGGGIGRSLDGEDVLGYFKFHLGYRFNRKKDKAG